MSITQLDAVLTGVYNVVRTYSAITTAGTPVYDGPVLGQNSDAEYIVVGHDADPEGTLAATSSQEWRTDGGASAQRDEVITLPVTVVVRSGDTDITSRRSRAVTLAGYVEAAIRANTTLSVSAVMWAEVSGHQLRQIQAPDGSLAVIESTVTVHTLI